MTDDTSQGLSRPTGRYKRMYMEFEVEVVDEMALRTFDLHPLGGSDGTPHGFLDLDVDERVAFAVAEVTTQALRVAEASTGIRWMGGGLPRVRWLDEAGRYASVTLPAMPHRRDDGFFDDLSGES